MPTGDQARKLAAVRAAARHDFPTAEIDRMLEEIEQGYLSVLDDAEFAALQDVASREGKSLSEWVRGVLRDARRGLPTGDQARKLAAVRAAARHDFPTAEIDRMLEEIEQGYLR